VPMWTLFAIAALVLATYAVVVLIHKRRAQKALENMANLNIKAVRRRSF
jgi:hypothetical protein